MSLSTVLQDEFERRRVRNARYSLRAFARALEIDHSTLSQMIRGQRPISDRMLEQFARRLGMAKSELMRRCEIERFDGKVLGAIAAGEHFTSHELATVTGADVDQINVALHRLLRLGLLAMRGAVWYVSKEARS